MDQQLGNLYKERDGFKIAFQRNLPHNIETVWDAITNPEKLKLWFTDFEMGPSEGDAMKIIFRDENKTITHGQIVSIQKPNLFIWKWEDELAVWELEAQGTNSCILKLTYSKLADDHVVGTAGGFHTLLERLEAMLNGNNQYYPFGTEAFNPEQAELREKYTIATLDVYPELQQYNPFEISKVFNVSSDKIWHALTDNNLTKLWYFDFKDQFNPVVGHEFEWIAGDNDGKQWLHRGIVTEVIPGEKLVHTWEYPGYSGSSQITWILQPETSDRTNLKLIHEFSIPFDKSVPELQRKNFSSGWHHIINTSLADFLEKK